MFAKEALKIGNLSEKGTIAAKQKLLQCCRMVGVAMVLELLHGWPTLSFLLLLLQTPNVCHAIPRIECCQIAGLQESNAAKLQETHITKELFSRMEYT